MDIIADYQTQRIVGSMARAMNCAVGRKAHGPGTFLMRKQFYGILGLGKKRGWDLHGVMAVVGERP